MSDYRRYFVPGATYFLTVVVYKRRPILVHPDGNPVLRNAIRVVQEERPFRIIAMVLLPDHWHTVISLPRGDADYSQRVRSIKQRFSHQYLSAGGTECEVTASQRRRHERGVWQPRFWEHTVRDEDDLERCVDYIHWNPRKHELVHRVRDWPWSTFHHFVTAGQYDLDWGGTLPESLEGVDNWGE